MEELYPRIEDYLDNAMTDAERAAFEAEVQADPILANALAQVQEARERLARQWVQEQSEAELSATLKELGKKHFSGSGKTRRLQFSPWWMALAAVLTALLVWLGWPASEATLYERYRKFPEAAFATKSGATQSLEQTANQFNTGDFDGALSGLTAYLQQNPDDTEARFFAGLCQMELSRLQEAETTFRQIVESKNAWSEEARWFLALAYLKGRKHSDCRETLNQIPPGGTHYEQAQNLLKKIQKRF
ncbi:MAG: hypothetical protein OHK0019_20670 [Saprospiraceae bacterium]